MSGAWGASEWVEHKPGLWKRSVGPFVLVVLCRSGGYDGEVHAEGPMTEPHGDRKVRIVGTFDHPKTLRDAQVLAESISASALDWVLRLADEWRSK